ncbi:MAG: hypothetical protein AB7P21_13075 [Lautropia sp.]
MSSDDVGTFVPIGCYAWPAMPTEDAIRRFVGPILERLRKRHAAPHVAEDRLRRTRSDDGDAAEAPVCNVLLRELAATLDPWAAGDAGADTLRLVVLPPCEDADLLEHWASANGHRLVSAPPLDPASLERPLIDRPHDRASPLAGALAGLLADPAPDDTARVFVVPHLEHWFLRHRHGLALARALLAGLDASRRRWVVGCNSWAWRYLQKAADADAILPRGLGFSAFDANRLRGWIAESGTGKRDGRALCFRRADSGAVVLRVPSDASQPPPEGPAEDHFRVLAAHSFGIPWVAWHTWRESLRSRVDADTPAGEHAPPDRGEPGDRRPDERVFWIADVEAFTLPQGREPDALLVLHALLLHGGLGIDALRAVLPTTQALAVVPALLSAGFIAHGARGLHCRALAYPAIRRALVAAGYPADIL